MVQFYYVERGFFMKKILKMLVIGLFVCLTPVSAFAEVKVMGLEETLVYNEIEPEFENYKETKEQIPIYLFYADWCPHCHDFLEYLNSIADEKGYMFKLRSYEKQNDDNLAVYKKVGAYFGQKEFGVPYIVIGESTFYGYGDDDKENILKAIEEEYNAEEKFDVFDHLGEKKEEDAKKSSKVVFLIVPVLIIVVGGIIMLAMKSGN